MSAVTAIRPAVPAAGASAPPSGIAGSSVTELPPRGIAWTFNQDQLEAALSASFDQLALAGEDAKQIVRDFLYSPAAKKLRIGDQP